MLTLAILVFLGIICIEAPRLTRQKMWRELLAFAMFLSLGMALSIPQILGIELPSPIKLLEVIYKPLGEWLKVP